MKDIVPQAVADDLEIVVTGNDMFGAPFSERTRLLNLAREEFSFPLYRPVSENSHLEVNFHPQTSDSPFWVRGVIVDVRTRLDGMQTVGVRVTEL